MRPLSGVVSVGVVLMLALALGGCGSTGGGGADVTGMGKIREYVGDGGGA